MQGSVRKRGSVWYYRFSVYENGKRKQIERNGGSTKKEALAKLNEELNRENKGITRPDEMLLSDYLNMWLNDYIKDLKSENTYFKYKTAIEKKINPAIGNISLCDLRVIHIEKFLIKLRKSDLSNTTVQGYLGTLNTALNKAVKLQMILSNPCALVDRPKRDKFKAEVLTFDELKSIYNYLDPECTYEDYIFSLALDIAVELGLRRGEMCGLEFKDIDYENSTISINKSFIRIDKRYAISDTKTEESNRTLPISQTLLEKIKKHKQRLNRYKLQYGTLYQKAKFEGEEYDLLFRWEDGSPIIPSNFLQRLKRICKNIKINKNVRWHDLRHTNATFLLEKGINMKVVQERLGHSLMQTTSDTYAHVTQNMNREATNALSNFLYK